MLQVRAAEQGSSICGIEDTFIRGYRQLALETPARRRDVLLRALPLISEHDIHLLIFGSGEEEVKLRELATELHLEARVRFGGYRRDIPSLLGSLDLYVHPSRFEGMPNALLEAMAAAQRADSCQGDGNAVSGSKPILLSRDRAANWHRQASKLEFSMQV